MAGLRQGGYATIRSGRMLKEFILQYLSGPALRMRIRRGLLKVEQMHALARDLLGSGADSVMRTLP